MRLKKRYIKPFFEFSLIEEDGDLLGASQYEKDNTGEIPGTKKEEGGYWDEAKLANPFDFEAQGGYYIEDNDF